MAVMALRQHHIKQLEERLLAGSSWQESGFVFTSMVGTPLEPRNVYRQFQKALERAQLPHARFHDLRHTCATLLLVQGVPARVVMETLGHSQISLTMNTYSHVLPDLQREAANQIDRLLVGEQ
jgi:integrase